MTIYLGVERDYCSCCSIEDYDFLLPLSIISPSRMDITPRWMPRRKR